MRAENLPNARVSHGTSLSLASCTLPGFAGPARCGVLEVAENPDKPDSRRLAIGVAVLPASSGHARPDPIVPLMGGPGEDAIGAAEYTATRVASLRQDRDILLVDQRGTGRSNALQCELFSTTDPGASLRDVFPLAAVEKCAQKAGTHADLTQYTYDRFANDLERVRRALGYGPLNLFAGSYGTRAAQVYARMYPKSVRTMYLGSVVPLDAANPLHFSQTAQTALNELLAACSADPACNAAFPDLRAEFRELADRLAAGPVRVNVKGYSGTMLLYGGRVAEWFRSQLYRPRSSDDLPWLIHQAHLGDWTAIAAGILADTRAADSGLSLGLLFAVTCSEDVPFIREDDVSAETRGTFLGDYRIRQQQAACRYWPRVTLPKGYRDPLQTSIPTVFASGDSDGDAPLSFTRAVAPGFSRRREVLLQGQGHTEWNDCIARIYGGLVTTGSVSGPVASSCPRVPRPAFKTGRP